MDDIVVKSKKRWNLLHDLRETFDNLRKYKMMLNPKNVCLACRQESSSATWYRLGGIDANPTKVEAIEKL
jgi:hypothetical protein